MTNDFYCSPLKQLTYRQLRQKLDEDFVSYQRHRSKANVGSLICVCAELFAREQ